MPAYKVYSKDRCRYLYGKGNCRSSELYKGACETEYQGKTLYVFNDKDKYDKCPLPDLDKEDQWEFDR